MREFFTKVVDINNNILWILTSIKKYIFWSFTDFLTVLTSFSVFTWILIQIQSLKSYLLFFSYSQVINDSILLLPFILIYILWLYISYELSQYVQNNFNQFLKLSYLTFSSFLLMGFWPIITTTKITSDNFLFSLFMLFLWFFLINLLIFSFISFILPNKLNFISTYVAFVFWVVFYFIFLDMYNDMYYKNVCFNNSWKLEKVLYRNDNYIITWSWIIKDDNYTFYIWEYCINKP